MRFSTSFVALSVPFLVQAAPIRRASAVSQTDIVVFQLAHVLEQLETSFYTQALQKFQAQDFIDAGFINGDVFAQQVQSIQFDEQTHTTALEAAITSFGQQPISDCQFDFSSVLTNVQTMAPVARLVEYVGVGAYLGAAHLLDDPRLLTTAGSILTVEARHQSILNIFNGGSAIPQAFDIPLNPGQVLGIAGAFISGCDLTPLGITPTAALTISNDPTKPIGPGTLLTFTSPALPSDTSNLFCDMIVGGATDSIHLPLSQCIVPANVNGPVAVSITNDTNPILAADTIDQSPLTVVAGPAMTFVDFGVQQQAISQAVLSSSSPLNKDLTGSGVSGGSSTQVSSSGSVITPDQASSIAASAGSSTAVSAGSSIAASAGSSTAAGAAPESTGTSGSLSGGAGEVSSNSQDTADETAETGPVFDVSAVAVAAPASTATAAVNAGAAPTDSTDSLGGADPTLVATLAGGDATADATADAAAAPTDAAAGLEPVSAAADSAIAAVPTDLGIAPVDSTGATNALIATPATFNAASPTASTADNGNVLVVGFGRH